VINNILIAKNQRVALGGCINGDVEGWLITNGNKDLVYELELEDRTVITLSDRYGVLVREAGKTKLTPANQLILLSNILMNDGSLKKLIRWESKPGVEILIPVEMFNLNGVLVLRKE
jgi:hypothetical protein